MSLSHSTKDRILAAASTAVIRKGTAGARMHEIAEKAGVSTATLHYHFGSKEELADRVLEAVLVRLVDRFLSAWSPDDTVASNVRGAVHVCMDELEKDSRVVGYVLVELHRNPDRFERVWKGLPATISYRFHKLLRSSPSVNRCARPEEFILDLVGLCAFPFLARPLLRLLLGPDDNGWESLLSKRREAIGDFLLPHTPGQVSTPSP